MNPPVLDTRIVPSSSARTYHAFGETVTVHLGAAETGGRYTMFTAITPPGGGPPPHVHAREDEWFLVVEGCAEFLKEGAWYEVQAGGALFTPKGVVHTFRNKGTTPLRMLVQTSPAGFEEFFSRCAAEFAKPAPPDMARIVQIAGEHGISFVSG
jgi:mannose-6-phosphate isomerase-like protein (cupin superfamily)